MVKANIDKKSISILWTKGYDEMSLIETSVYNRPVPKKLKMFVPDLYEPECLEF